MNFNDFVYPDAHIERTSLKAQTTNLLREMIVSGKISPGSKITERDVANWLKISRMPARDALMDLERQGLIVTKPGGRYVISLDEQNIRYLYQLRFTLEKLAVELAIENATKENLTALDAKLEEMRNAIAAKDMHTYSASDLEMHELIWQQAGNPYLLNMLNSMIGPIFMFIASQAPMIEDWQNSLHLHEQLVEMIRNKNIPAAINSIEAHTQHSFDLAFATLRK